jgi:hypothetical protein
MYAKYLINLDIEVNPPYALLWASFLAFVPKPPYVISLPGLLGATAYPAYTHVAQQIPLFPNTPTFFLTSLVQ